MNIFVSAVIVAAGSGKRFGGDKISALLGGQSVLHRVLDSFQRMSLISEIILVLAPERGEKNTANLFSKITRIVPGGRERQDSVRRGFEALDGKRTNIVLVHDGARPLVREDLIARVICAADAQGAAVPVIPVEDTVKLCKDGKVVQTSDRTSLFRVQTPQGFRYEILEQALRQAARAAVLGTDEATLVEEIGFPVVTVPGDPTNIKITTPSDMKIAEVYLDV